MKLEPGDEIQDDGSVKGKTFSGPGYKGEYPSPRYGKETYAEYHARVAEARDNGFHPGDLNQGDWTIYCMGSGVYEGANADATIR